MPASSTAPVADRPVIIVAEGVWGPPYERLAATFDVRRLDRPATAADLDGAAGLVVRNRTQVDRDLLASARLQVVARAGAGLDNIDLAAADDQGVVVLAAPGVNATSVAELAIGLAVSVSRRITDLDRRVRAGEWTRAPGHELAGRTWGLLSAGATGRATGRLAAALGMSVLAYDPYVNSDAPDLGPIRLCSLTEVITEADVLSVHLPATPETVGMINDDLLAQAKPELIVINVGRGEVLDEAALLRALQSGRIAGAALDVRGQEPPTPGGLEQLPNVVLTPHIAGITVESQHRIAEYLCAGLAAVLTGGEAAGVVGAVRTVGTAVTSGAPPSGTRP